MDIYYSEVRIGKENMNGLKEALLKNTVVADCDRTVEELMHDLYCVYLDTDFDGNYKLSTLDCDIDEQDMDEMMDTIAPFVKDGSFVVTFDTDTYVPDFRQYYFKDGKCEMYWAELFFEGSPVQRVAL